jgi:hypothetical protein
MVLPGQATWSETDRGYRWELYNLRYKLTADRDADVDKSQFQATCRHGGRSDTDTGGWAGKGGTHILHALNVGLDLL